MADTIAIVTITVLSFLYVGSSLAINQKLGSRSRLKYLQSQIAEINKDYSKALKENDKAKIEKMAAREKEMAGYMSEMMFLPFKSLIFILPVFFIFIGINTFGIQFNGVIQRLFPTFLIYLPFDLHPASIFALKIFQQGVYGSRGFFILCGVVAGIVLEMIYSAYENHLKQKSNSSKTEQKPSLPTT